MIFRVWTTKMKLLLCVIVLIIGKGDSQPCKDVESLDITLGEKDLNGSILYEGIEYENGSYWSREEDNETVIYGCPCIKRKCMWKCCGVSKMRYNGSCQETDQPEVNPFNPPVYNARDLVPELHANEIFFYMYTRFCTSRYMIGPNNGQAIYLQQDGGLLSIEKLGGSKRFDPGEFCLDMIGDVGVEGSIENIQLTAAVCYEAEDPDYDFMHLLYAWAIVVLSIPFLVITFFVYSCCPELRNVHGKCLLAYCGGLIVAYSILVYGKLVPFMNNGDMTLCYVMAFVMYYSFQSSFLWLNVMCYDIWKTFSRIRASSDNRRFIRYGIYAWGVALVLTIITAVMQFSHDLPEYVVRPRITESSCWFPGADWEPQLAYFYAPVLILVVCNITFFSITAYHIQATLNETQLLNAPESSRNMENRLQQHKHRYKLYIKLFVIMGVNWSMELISFCFREQLSTLASIVVVLVDLSNIAVGLAIFIIFVAKNKVVKRKWDRIRGRAPLSSDSTSRYVTNSSTAPTELTRISGGANEKVA